MTFDPLSSFHQPLKLLKFCGLQRTKDSTLSYKIIGMCVNFFIVDLSTLLNLANVNNLHGFADFADFMALLPSCIAVCLKSHYIAFNADEIASFVKELEEMMANKTLSDKLQKQLLATKRLFNIFMGSMMVACFFISFTPLLKHELNVKLWLPYDPYQSTKLFILTELYQIASGFSFGIVTITIDILEMTFMNYTAVLLEDICEQLAKINESKENRHEQLLRCIEQHQKLKRFVKEIERTFSIVFAIHGIKCSLVLCTTAVCITMVRDSWFTV